MLESCGQILSEFDQNPGENDQNIVIFLVN